MRWFPERKGLAAGLALTCFGMGAAVGAPLINFLIEACAQARSNCDIPIALT